MHDILRETPIYQEILKEGREEGLEQGLEQGLHKGIVIGRKEGIQEGLEQGKLKGLNEAVLKIVTQRFPKLVRLAKKQIFLIEDTDILLDLIGRLTVAQSAEEAKEHLLALDEDEEEGY